MTSKELVLYNSALGPFARIVRLQLAEKGIPYVTKDVSLSKGENILPWYVSLNPKMTVPTLTIGEKGAEEPEVVLSDSYDIIQYLENELNQGTSLVSSDPAETKQIWEIVDKWYALGMYIILYVMCACVVFTRACVCMCVYVCLCDINTFGLGLFVRILSCPVYCGASLIDCEHARDVSSLYWQVSCRLQADV